METADPSGAGQGVVYQLDAGAPVHSLSVSQDLQHAAIALGPPSDAVKVYGMLPDRFEEQQLLKGTAKGNLKFR